MKAEQDKQYQEMLEQSRKDYEEKMKKQEEEENKKILESIKKNEDKEKKKNILLNMPQEPEKYLLFSKFIIDYILNLIYWWTNLSNIIRKIHKVILIFIFIQ